MIARSALAIGLALALPATLAAQEPPTHDYPTQARVEYVMRCMNLHGGPSYDTMYACVCAVDHIADSLPYDEFVQAEMLGYLLSTPGARRPVPRRDAERPRPRQDLRPGAGRRREGVLHQQELKPGAGLGFACCSAS